MPDRYGRTILAESHQRKSPFDLKGLNRPASLVNWVEVRFGARTIVFRFCVGRITTKPKDELGSILEV
jgi:hypothetical protein